MINRDLAEALGIPDATVARIEDVHREIGALLESCDEGFLPSYYHYIEELEFFLQGLWGFLQNEKLHTWKHLYKFRCQWVGRQFRCHSTGEILVIPSDVYPKDYLTFGNAGVDLGILDGYYRMNNCEEIEGEAHE